ncbi:aminopeptidase [Thermoflexales bacterium]|nr:aminopeptidase [Thermoflexales bacterium]
MLPDFEALLQKYAELIIKVGLNLQPAQRLLVVAPLPSAPLVRQVATSAYQHGARLVEVFYVDEQLLLTRFQHAPRDSFDDEILWPWNVAFQYAQQGDAVLQLAGTDPDLLKGQDPALVQAYTLARSQALKPFSLEVARNNLNWLIASYASASWAAKVFPDLPGDQCEDRLWQAIFDICRVTQPDPIAAWQQHLQQLAQWRTHLTQKQYAALHYTAPGTDLTIGLPSGHIWMGGDVRTPRGMAFVPNMPTEEVFTVPHKEKIHGTVKASKPLSHNGTLIENFSLTFDEGRVVDVKAESGEAVLRNLIATDEGAASLGEVALVPYSSPISLSGLLFFNTLFDENAACHIALGRGLRFCLQNGATLSEEELSAQGVNYSLIHVDFMIGSDQMNIDAITADGKREPLMRHGEWAFAL